VPALGWRPVVAPPGVGFLIGPSVVDGACVGNGGSGCVYKGAVHLAALAGGIVLLTQSVSAGITAASLGAALVLFGLGVLRSDCVEAASRVPAIGAGPGPRALTSASPASAVRASWLALLVTVPALLLERARDRLGLGLPIQSSALVAFFGSRRAAPPA
jgi:hypothetical protein